MKKLLNAVANAFMKKSDKDQVLQLIFKDYKDNEKTAIITTERLQKILEEYQQKNKDVDLKKKMRLTLTRGKEVVHAIYSIEDYWKILRNAELCRNVVPSVISDYLVDLTVAYTVVSVIPIVNREEEIEKIWFYLSQESRNNVYLTGDMETGKTAIALEIARRMAAGECPKEFLKRRAFLLKAEDLAKLSSKAQEDEKNGKIQKKFATIVESLNRFFEQNKENMILVIDDGVYMKTDEILIYMLQDLIKKYQIPMISTLSTEEYEEYFLNDTSINKHLNYVYVEEPELEEIKPMIEVHSKVYEKEYNIKISDEMLKFAIFTSGLTNSVSSNPGNVLNVLRRAFIEAKRKEKKEVDKQCILSCYDSYLKFYNKMSFEKKKSTAYHEVGHYIVYMHFKDDLKDNKTAFVSILPMMDFLGVNWRYEVKGELLNYTKDLLMKKIAISMGGKAAEKILLDMDENDGAYSDLLHANEYAEGMVLYLGFSERVNGKNRNYVAEDGSLKTYLISDKKKKEFDAEIQKILDEGYKMAENIVKQNRKLIEKISYELLEKEILTGEELEKIVEEYKAKTK